LFFRPRTARGRCSVNDTVSLAAASPSPSMCSLNGEAPRQYAAPRRKRPRRSTRTTRRRIESPSAPARFYRGWLSQVIDGEAVEGALSSIG
jgi:hypothetical protein